MQNSPPNIAKILKKLRTERALSLSKTAELTGVSKAMLGQIELGQSSPTVAILWKIATGFNIPFSNFLEVGKTKSPELHDFENLPIFEQAVSGMRVTSLIPFDPILKVDLFKIELIPGALSQSSPHEKGVIEHVIVFQGVLKLTLNQEQHVIKAGESFRFSADVPHSYANESEETVVLHNLIHYPK